MNRGNVETMDKVEALFKYAKENSLLEDPKRISKLYDEARRRWGHLMTRYKIGKIMEDTLRKMKKMKTTGVLRYV